MSANCHNQGEPKEAGQLMVMYCLGGDLGAEKGLRGNLSQSNKAGLELMTIHQHWFINCDKCVMQMLMLMGILCTIFIIFLSILNNSKIKSYLKTQDAQLNQNFRLMTNFFSI